MYKKFFAILIVLVLAFSSVNAFAADKPTNDEKITAAAKQPVIYERTITVTEKGGLYNVGFATLYFPENFLADERLPATFDVSVYAVNGEAGIEINPSTNGFLKSVYIYVDNYNGLLYDKALGKNVKTKIKKQVIEAPHFSWFRFR